MFTVGSQHVLNLTTCFHASRGLYTRDFKDCLAGQQSISCLATYSCLLFVAMKAALAYALWAMRATKTNWACLKYALSLLNPLSMMHCGLTLPC